jgi:hypothetical protein
LQGAACREQLQVPAFDECAEWFWAITVRAIFSVPNMALYCHAPGARALCLVALQVSVGVGLFSLIGELTAEGKARRLARRMLDVVGSSLLLVVMCWATLRPCLAAPHEAWMSWLNEYPFRGELSVQSLQLSIVCSSNFH